MKLRGRRGVLAGLLSSVGVAVFAGSAFAGYFHQPAVTIDTVNRTAEGSMVGARVSSNTVEHIGVTSGVSGVWFWAQNSAGTYRSCFAPSPSTDFRVLASSISDQSLIRFEWDQHTGYCTGDIRISNGSQYTNP